MSLTLTDAWKQAMLRATVEPVFIVEVKLDASTTYKFCSSPHSPLATTNNGDYTPIVSSVDPISGSIDPVKRTFSRNQINISFTDEGPGSFIRNLLSGNRLRGRKVTVKLGEVSLDSSSDFADYFVGVLADFVPSEGEVTFATRDAMKILQDATLPGQDLAKLYWHNKHPLEVIEDILERAGVPSELYDGTSLDPDSYTSSISHWGVTRSFKGLIDSSVKEDQSAWDLVQELAVLLHGVFAPREDGTLAFARFDASASSSADFTEDDIQDFEQIETTGNIANTAVIKFDYAGQISEANRDPEKEYGFARKIVHSNADAKSNYAYPGESESVFTRTISTRWLEAVAMLESDLTSGASTISVIGGHADSFSGMRDDGSSGWEPSASRPVYLLVVDNRDGSAEVIECDGITMDSDVYTDYTEVGGTVVQNTLKGTYDITTSGRKWTEGGSGTGRAFDAGCFVYDVTIAVDWAKTLIERLSEGLPIVRFRTSLFHYGLQLGELATFAFDLFLSYDNDGQSGSDKWEAIGKEVDVLGDSPGVVWTLAKATSTTGYTEEWEPGQDGVDTDANSDPSDAFEPDWVDVLGGWIGGGLGAGSTASPEQGGSLFNPFAAEGLLSRPGSGGTFVDVDQGKFVAGGFAGGRMATSTGAAKRSIEMAASKDSYIRMDGISRRHVIQQVSNGAGEPSLPINMIKVAKAVTDATTVTSVDDQRVLDGIRGSKLSEFGSLFFGDGSDGDAVISSATNLTRTMYYNNLTIRDGGSLRPKRYPVYVKGTLTLTGTGEIGDSGNNGSDATSASGASRGGGLTGAVLGGSAAGGDGGSGGTSGSENGSAGGNSNAPTGGSLGGTASAAGGGGDASGSSAGKGATGGGSASLTVAEQKIRSITTADTWWDAATSVRVKGGAGGAGGGGGGATSSGDDGGGGGGGGAGGGCVLVMARRILTTGVDGDWNPSSNGGIRARGGNGGNGANGATGFGVGGGGGGGGSGGGGGCVVVVCQTVDDEGTLSSELDASGGSAGLGGSGNNGSQDGSPGAAGQDGTTRLIIG